MKKILQYLKKFYADYFSWVELSIALIFLVGFCFLRYFKFIPSDYGELSLLTSWWYKAYFTNYKFSFHFALYLSPLIIGYIVSSIVHKDWNIWTNPKFIFLVLFGVAVFSFRTNLTFIVNDALVQFANYEHFDWLKSVLGTIARGSFVFLSILVYWYFTDKEDQPFYGFTKKNFDTKPYFVMLLIMVPLIALASTQPDFLESYPRVQKFSSLDFANSAHWKHFALYEFLYGLDFFSIEFFFRGFMILAFVGIVGPRAIIPMAYIYVVIHWNKPMGELISSFFGGSLLGIVAYYSRSILGGIIAHVGIAWMMEIGAFISKYFYP
ncbi:CPBP family intramembrane metalloprotease [Bacteroidia bacterium]|nr:CPBP family intramembrane metalloprotease [Bacteroidia bacterium]